jgi:Transposase DDE domain
MCHDRLLAHKDALFEHLVERWRDLFNASFDVLLYDLTSTYFEADPPFPEGDKRRHGYSRDHRPDCVQVVIALVVTPDGLPLAYEVLPGNTADNTTLRGFLARIERQYGKARRIWLMDRGIPSEEVLAEMRAADPPVQYVVGTPKGRLTRLEQDLWPGRGRRRGQGCRSSCCRSTASSTSSPRAAIASPRSVRCAGDSSSGCGGALRKSPP